jgi:shikimate kinase
MRGKSAGGNAPPRIALIGMMGSGKTTAGRRLAKLLGYRFVDMDREISMASGKGVARIFEDEGESAFRRREAALLRKIARLTGVVVSTGGGIILSARNRVLLRTSFRAVWLRVPATEILRRIGPGRGRPVLNLVRGMPPDARLSYLRELARTRAPLYAEAGVPVRADGRSPDQLARVIARELGIPRGNYK